MSLDVLLPDVRPVKEHDLDTTRMPRAQRAGRAQPIEVGYIDPNPFQPKNRVKHDDLGPLIASIQNNGFFGHLEVRSDPENPGGRVQLVYGHRRLEAARLAGERSIPCLHVAYSDAQMRSISLMENMTQKKLGRLEEAEQVVALMEAMNWSVRGARNVLGVSKGYVENCIALTKMPEQLKARMREGGDVSVSVAMAFQRLRNKPGVTPDEINKLADKYLAEGWGVVEAEQMVKLFDEPADVLLDEMGREVRTIKIEDRLDEARRKAEAREALLDDAGPDPIRLANRFVITGNGLDFRGPKQPNERTGERPNRPNLALLPTPSQADRVVSVTNIPAQEDPENRILRRWVPERTEIVSKTGREYAEALLSMVEAWRENLPRVLDKADVSTLTPDERKRLWVASQVVADNLLGLRA